MNPLLSDSSFGNYIWINGVRHDLEHHPTDFTVLRPDELLTDTAEYRVVLRNQEAAYLSATGDRDAAMEEIRRTRPAYHLYLAKLADGTFQPGIGEILITDQIFLILKPEDPELLDQLISRFSVEPVGSMGAAHVLRITAPTGENTLKTANRIAEYPGVASCEPERLLRLLKSAPPSTAPPDQPSQWYLGGNLTAEPDPYDPGINLVNAWKITRGDPGIVVAIIDDGFAMHHPVFEKTAVNPGKYNFADNNDDPSATEADNHGTPVASLVVGSAGGMMYGVAPLCSFLPIRIASDQLVSPTLFLRIFNYVSSRADVAVLTYGSIPTPIEYFPTEFRNQVTALLANGGRLGRGLVLVVSSGNQDAPTFLPAAENKNGIAYVFGLVRFLPPGNPVYSDFSSLEGTIVAAAYTSSKRKAGYSSWGPSVTISAPSNNFHGVDLALRAAGVVIPRAAQFMARYPGKSILAAVNPTATSTDFPPLTDDPGKPGVRSLYTGSFGGTSAAAPLVAGAAALILSVNPRLSPADVASILQETAHPDLDPVTTPDPDPNLQGLSGQFINHRSLTFGAGRLDIASAVERAKSK